MLCHTDAANQRIETNQYASAGVDFCRSYDRIQALGRAHDLPQGAIALLLALARKLAEPSRRADQGARVMLSRRGAANQCALDESTVTRARRCLVAAGLIIPLPELGHDAFDLAPVYAGMGFATGAVEAAHFAREAAQNALPAHFAATVPVSLIQEFDSEKNNDDESGDLPTQPAVRAGDLGVEVIEALRCAPRLRAVLEDGIAAAGWAGLSRLIGSRIGDICGAYSAPSPIDTVLWRRAAERHGEMALVALAYVLEAYARGKVGFPAQWMNWFSRREAIDLATNLAALRQFTAEDERATQEAARIAEARREQASVAARKSGHERAALALRETVHTLVAQTVDRDAADYAERAITAHVAVAGNEHGAPRRVFWMGRVDDRARAILDQAMIAHGLQAADLEIDRVMPSAVKLAMLPRRPSGERIERLAA